MLLAFPLCVKAEFTKGSVIVPCTVAVLAALDYHRQAIHIQPSSEVLCNSLSSQAASDNNASKMHFLV